MLTRTTSTEVPWVSISIEGFIACIILFITSEQTSLQAMSVFSQVISFSLSTLAAFFAVRTAKDVQIHKIIPVLGMMSSGYIMYLSFQKIIASGISFSFLALFTVGALATIYQKFTTLKSAVQPTA